MFSLLSMTANAVASLFIHVLKAVFSMLSWFVRAFVRALKLLFCLLPITAVLFALLFCANIFLLFSSGTAQPAFASKGAAQTFMLPDAPDIRTPAFDVPAEEVIKGADKALENSSYVIVEMFTALKSWWLSSVYVYKGNIAYIFLLVLTIVMFVPVITILLSISIFASFGNVLFVSIIIDMILYLLRALFGKNFVEQLMDRYYRLFPEAGKRHCEKDYERWLKKHHREFTEDNDEDYEDYRERRRKSFYEDEDEDEEDEYYEEDDYDDYDDYDDFYEDEDDIDDAEYEDEYAEDESAGSFDFFAGCSSRESVDRKYKSLVKLYHPDNMDGDTAALQEINVQYDRAKKRFK